MDRYRLTVTLERENEAGDLPETLVDVVAEAPAVQALIDVAHSAVALVADSCNAHAFVPRPAEED